MMGGIGGGGFGGGFGGNGGEDADDPSVTRMHIARLSSLLSNEEKNPRSKEVIGKLEQPATLHFPTETPLEEVLKRIRDLAKGNSGKRLSIYVNPEALQEAEKTMTSPVIIDLEDVPLRLALRLVLQQLGLAYCVRDGVVMINTPEGVRQELQEALAELGYPPSSGLQMMMGRPRGMTGMGGAMMGGGLQ